ncbi:tyrosine-type recombinase/integrase [Streptomyces sp. NPDC002845]
MVDEWLGDLRSLRDLARSTIRSFLFALLWETGLRIGEALGLRHEDLAAAEGELTVTPRANDNRARAKSASPRIVPVGPEIVRLYADYLHGGHRGHPGPAAVRRHHPAVAARAGQTVRALAAEHRPQRQPGRHRHPGPQPLLRLPGQSPPRRRHARPRGPGRAGTLPRRPGPGSALDPFPQPGHRLAERVLPRRAPPRLGSQPPGECDLLPRRLPPTRQAAAPGAGRARDGPGRTARQPRPLAQPRRPCADLDPHALWAAGRRCLQLGLRLRHPGR